MAYRVVRSRTGWAVVSGADTLREFASHAKALEDASRRAGADLDAGVGASFEDTDEDAEASAAKAGLDHRSDLKS